MPTETYRIDIYCPSGCCIDSDTTELLIIPAFIICPLCGHVLKAEDNGVGGISYSDAGEILNGGV